MSWSDCIFCRLPPDRLIASSGDFRLVACLGPVTRGHILLVPDVHVPGLLDLPTGRLADLDAQRKEIRQEWARRYGGCMLVEHGRHGSGRGDYHAHAHLHVIPVDFSIREEIYTTTGGDYVEGSYLIHRRSIVGEYLFYSDNQDPDIFANFRRSPPRLFVRKILARRLGVPEKELDWRHFPREDLIALSRVDAAEIVRGRLSHFTPASNFGGVRGFIAPITRGDGL